MKTYQKIVLTFGFWLLAFGYGKAQNLVPNGDFEAHSQCPDNNSQITYANNWYIAGGSPDYFNFCASSSVGTNVPNNGFGYQHDCCGGNGYAGEYMMVSMNTIGDDIGREYLGIKLIDTLKTGHKYLASMYISRSNDCSYSIATIGILFTDTAIILPNPNQANLIIANPQVKNMSPLTDTANWMLVQDTITAIGHETYLTIGNFNTTATSDTISGTCGHYGSAYYFIDGVSVYDVATIGIEQNKNNIEVNLYPNPNNGSFTINYAGTGKQLTIEVYNVMGQQVLSQQYNVANNSNIPVNGLSEGVYFVKMNVDNVPVKTEKIIVTK